MAKKASKGYAYGAADADKYEDDADDEKDWVEVKEGEEGGGDERPDPIVEVTAAAKVISDAIDKLKDNNPQLADRAQTLLADALRMGLQVAHPK